MRQSAWSAFCEEARRSSEASRYEPLDPSTWHSLQTFAPLEKPQALLFFTKPFLSKLWLSTGIYPDALLSMARYGIPTLQYWRVIADTARRAGLPICFVGDLDPLDLTTFLVLCSGDPELRHPDREALRISYVGIDDAWLKLSARHARRKGDSLWFNMSELELQHRDVLLQMAPWLLELVGPRCAEFLQSGRKIELEGAASPDFHDEEFILALRDHLLRRIRVRPLRARPSPS